MKSATLSTDELAAAAWPAAVGKRLAARTGPVHLYGRKLVVDVEDAIWQRQLVTLAPQILPKIKAILGPDIVEVLEFQIGVPRREPQRASALDARADGIQDPIFRQLYLHSRARAERVEQLRKRNIA